ncbi:MAG: aminopeptidase P family protein [Chloroflexi bacterium]|nr:MAG: aminopeptidase P family protein [Chloroflexota bacterium]RLT29859.1 MAG: aminopeptidase P family protein [Chloroflexota bacterium]
MSAQQSGVSAAEIATAYADATPALGAGHALEARLIGAGAYARRLAAARDAAEAAGLDALLIGFGADMRYLTGYAAPALERLTMLVVPVRGEPSLIVPRLEAGMAGDAPAMRGGHVARVAWGETDDPFALVATAVRAGARAGSAPISVAVSDRLWATFVLRIDAALAAGGAAAPTRLASSVLSAIRMVKAPEEAALLRAAGRAVDSVVLAITSGKLLGRSESDVAREVRERLTGAGHEVASFAIVASGPNSASPHHEAGPRIIEAGDAIVLDIGGQFGGYGSDTTRTIWVTGRGGAVPPSADFVRRYELVKRANAAATAAAKPGVSCEAVDAAAREVIVAGGEGERFFHRTGHGIGLEEHEDPYIVAGNRTKLEPGHAFSIEPGIYVEGTNGARIEDIVICTADGVELLNATSRDLYVVEG